MLPIYTPESFLQSEYKRVESAWFWRAMMQHLAMFAEEHTKLALSLAGSDEKNLRVAAAMASAYRTALELPAAIAAGKILLPGQRLGNAPSRTAPDNSPDAHQGEDDA